MRKSPDECRITSKKTQHTQQHDQNPQERPLQCSLKEKVSLEALKGKKTLLQIVSENNISPELVRQWKKQAQEGVSQIFKRSKSREKALEEQNELLKSLLCKREQELE